MSGNTRPKLLSNGCAAGVATRPIERRAEIIERAAIMEIDGGLQRAEAEEAALQIWVRMQLDGKSEIVN